TLVLQAGEGGVSGLLAAELATALAAEPGGLTGRALANKVRRRRADVLAALSSDTGFQHTGQGRGSRWRLAARVPLNGAQDPRGPGKGCGPPGGHLRLPDPQTGRTRGGRRRPPVPAAAMSDDGQDGSKEDG